MEKIKLLIVEDNKVDRNLYNMKLDEDVFEKRFVETGKKALEAYEEWKPDIILLDIMLPGTSGYTVLKEIREKQKDLFTTIIIASALSDREDILQCAQYGIQGYLIKPINLHELNIKILRFHGDSHPDKALQTKPFLYDS